MKKILTFGLIALISFTALFTGCSGPFDSLTTKNDQQDVRLSDIEADLSGIHAWMITTDEQLATAFELIADNAGDIAQLRIDMNAGDAALQAQLDALVDLFWEKYAELHARIDGVVDQQNADRAEYRMGLMMAYGGIGYTNWRVSQLEDAFGAAAADFQAQIDGLTADLAAAKAACIAAIADLQGQIDDVNIELDTKITLAQAEMEMYRVLFGDIAIDANGELKGYYRDMMYWNDIFQGYNRVVNGLLYQIAQGIKMDSYTPPAHVANAVVQALRDFYVSEVELDIAVADLQGQIDALSALLATLRSEFDVVANDYLTSANEIILMDAIALLRADLVAGLATKLSVSTFTWNRTQIYETIENLATAGTFINTIELNLHSNVPAGTTVSISTSDGAFFISQTGPLTFSSMDFDMFRNALTALVDITVDVPSFGIVVLEDVPVYKLVLGGSGFPYLVFNDWGSYQSMGLTTRFGGQAVRF